MCDKMAISAYILKIVEKDPFLRLQMRAKEMFNRHQFFPPASRSFTRVLQFSSTSPCLEDSYHHCMFTNGQLNRP